MPLPTVSNETHELIEGEWVNGNPDATSFVGRIMDLMSSENPAIADVLFKFFLTQKDKPWFGEALIYACHVYAVLSAEGPLPRVSPEVGAPIQAEFLQDPQKYVQEALRKMLQTNRGVTRAIATLTFDMQATGQIEKAAMVPLYGVFVYQLLEAQLTSQELSQRLAV